MHIDLVTLSVRDPADSYSLQWAAERTGDRPAEDLNGAVVDLNDGRVVPVCGEIHRPTYWTGTAWRDEDAMRSFMRREPHLSTMGRIGDWCDEATFVDWEQSSADMPDWRAGYDRLIADGQGASLTHPSAAQAGRSFPAPVTGP